MAPVKPTDEYRIQGRLAVRGLARELFTSGTPVAIFGDNDTTAPLLTRVVQLDSDTISFDAGSDGYDLNWLRSARTLTVVGLPGSVRIQFDVAAPSIVPGRTHSGAAAHLIVCSLPSRGWRIQRRNAFRIAPPRIDQARVIVRLPRDDGELSLAIDDLSIGGLSARWPGDREAPAAGDGYRHCRIESEAATPIPCDLEVARVQPGHNGQPHRISFAFYAMPAEVVRLVQMYVTDIERRNRARR